MSGVIKAVSRWDIFFCGNYTDSDLSHHSCLCICFCCLSFTPSFQVETKTELEWQEQTANSFSHTLTYHSLHPHCHFTFLFPLHFPSFSAHKYVHMPDTNVNTHRLTHDTLMHKARITLFVIADCFEQYVSRFELLNE